MESKPEVNSGVVTGGEAFIETLRNEPEIEIDKTKFTPRHERCPEDKQGRTIQEVLGLSVEDLRTRDFTVEKLKEIGKAYRPWYLLTKHWSIKRAEALLWHRNPEGRNQCAYCLKESGLEVHHVQQRNSSGEVIYDAYDKLGEEDVKTDLTVPGVVAQKAWGIDVFNGTEQELELAPAGGNDTRIKGLLIKDYPTLIRIKK